MTIPHAGPAAKIRVTLTGDTPLTGLSYRVSGYVNTATHSAYVAGQVPSDITNIQSAVYAPVDRYGVFFGVSYAFASGEKGEGSSDAPL